MNILESHNTEFIPATEETCARFTIDSPIVPFILHSITKDKQEYTLSFWIKGDADGTIEVNMHEIPVTTAWTRHVFTYIATGRNLNFLFKNTGAYYIYRPKLEIGNTASDWTAHPSDDFVLNEFKLDLSPAGAAFTDGTNIPVTVNKNGMVAQSIETGNLTINRDSEHRHGDWVWKQRGNGNYGLQWKGVTE